MSTAPALFLLLSALWLPPAAGRATEAPAPRWTSGNLTGIGKDGRVIAPGHPERSELARRMAVRGPNQMPLIGSDKVDPAGLALIREWIARMPDAAPER